MAAALERSRAIHIGHSTGGGEVARYIARYGTSRVSKVVLIGTVQPLMVKAKDNPGGLPVEIFDPMRANVRLDRSAVWLDLSAPFYGYNRGRVPRLRGRAAVVLGIGNDGESARLFLLHQGVLRNRPDGGLESVRRPKVILHGDDDQIVPIENSAKRSVKLIKNSELKVIP